MPVSDKHEDYVRMEDERKLVKAAASGERAVKALGPLALSPPDIREDGQFNAYRYKSYKQRASYTNYTGRTKNGLSGAAFRKPPEVELPSGLEYLDDDADGEGQSITQLAKAITASMFQSGREIILVDYPSVELEQDENGNTIALTAAQVRAQDLKAAMKRYYAEDLINWRTAVVNGKEQLTQAVLRETYDASDDEFTTDNQLQYRVLRLREEGYTQQLYKEGITKVANKIEFVVSEEVLILANGKPLPFIPIFVAGAQSNDIAVDEIPLADIANVNISHYRNSADSEDSAFLCGQPMLHIDIGETNDSQWAEMNPNGVTIGSKTAIQTVKGKVEMVQADERNIFTTMMEAKEKQMVALGAKIIENNGTQMTGTEARIDAAGENSVLADIVGNIEEMIQVCIEWCGEFMGVPVDGKKAFKMNREFFPESADPQLVMAAIQLHDRGIVALSDMQDLARKAGVVHQDRDNKDIDAEAEAVSPLTGFDSNKSPLIDR